MIGAMALLLCISTNSFAQRSNISSDTIHVDGICGQCQKRIVNAAYIKGVKHAEWNVQTKQLIVVYSPKTSLDKIEKSIAHAGHNAGVVKATQEEYKKLPNCCAYKEEVNAHE